MYKPGQGYYTRVGTAIGAGVLILWAAVFLFGELANLGLSRQYDLPVRYGVSVGFILLVGAVLYWVIGLNRKVNDFFIATEGEMKKVSWSTWPEVIRSTKVVVVSVVILAVFLFVVDMAFMLFFSSIGVLKAAPTLSQLFGIKS